MTTPKNQGIWAGFPLHVEDSGAGVPVILLHSSGLSGRQWRRLAAELPERGFRAIVPDLTGHGASDPWPEGKPFSYEVDVDHVVEMLARLGTPAHLVGHSYGGLLALLAAKAAPARVRSVVAYDPVAFGALDAAKDGDAAADLDRIDFRWEETDEGRERWLKQFVEYWGGPGAWASLREEARDEFRRVGWIVREGARSLSGDRTQAVAYRAFGGPIHLLSGEKSPVAARRLIERISLAVPDVSVVTVLKAGHLAPLTHADMVNGLVVRALLQPVRPEDTSRAGSGGAYVAVRREITLDIPYDRFTQRFEALLGKMDVDLLSGIEVLSPDQARARLSPVIGPSGLTLFQKIDQGGILTAFTGRAMRAATYVFGNVLIAVEMTRHVPRVGLYVAQRLYACEAGPSHTTVTYDLPTAAAAQFESPDVDAVARRLEKMIAHLVLDASVDPSSGGG